MMLHCKERWRYDNPHSALVFLQMIILYSFIIFSIKAKTTALTTIKLHLKKRNNMVVGDYRFSYT